MYNMFTTAGNTAVEAVVNRHLGQDYANAPAMFRAIHEDLDRLQAVSCFAEATDTEVREAVWTTVSNKFSSAAWTAAEGAAVEKYMSD